MAAKSKQKTIANSKNSGVRLLSGPRHRSITEVTEPETGSSSTSINEIKPGNSSAGEACKFGDRPPIQGSACEYTSLMAACKTRKAGPRYGTLRYTAEDASSGDNDSCCSASDEMSSTSCGSSGVGANKMSWRQVLVLVMVLLNAFASSLTVCLFPPFYPRLAEMKGTTATSYGLIIGTSCLVAFIVTPFIGKHLPLIGVKFSFCFGTFAGGVCCALSGLLEFFEPGQSFIIFSVLTRVLHAFANALVITSTFAYQAMEFPSSVAKVFSVTRCVMNVTQLFGPVVGGVLHEAAGFYLPFVVMGGLQVILAFFSIFLMPPPYYSEENADYNHNKKKAKLSILGILKIPTIWFSFGAFIIATMCNGFISVNLEPEVLRQFQLSPIYIGLVFGLKDGANSIASPVWGFICDSQKKSVKPYLIGSSLLVALSFFLLGKVVFMYYLHTKNIIIPGGSQWFGIMISLTLPIVVAALCVNGVGIGGQQVVGVVDALHEASRAGYPDDPATQVTVVIYYCL